MWRSFFAALVAFFPAKFLPDCFFDKEAQFWQHEILWFVVFLAMFMLATYLMQRFAKPVNKKL